MSLRDCKEEPNRLEKGIFSESSLSPPSESVGRIKGEGDVACVPVEGQSDDDDVERVVIGLGTTKNAESDPKKASTLTASDFPDDGRAEAGGDAKSHRLRSPHRQPKSGHHDRKKTRRRGVYRTFPFLNLFRDSRLERAFLDEYYGKDRSWYFFVACLVGTIMYGQFAFTEDIELWPVWSLTAGIVAAWYFFGSFLYILPPFVHRKPLLEFHLAVGCILGSMRFGMGSIARWGLERGEKGQFGAVVTATSIFFFEMCYNLIMRPRAIVVLISESVNALSYSIYCPLLSMPHEDFRAIASVIMFWVFNSIIIGFITGLNVSTRELFLVAVQLRENRNALLAEIRVRDALLRNILPSEMVPRIQAATTSSEDENEHEREVWEERKEDGKQHLRRLIAQKFEGGCLLQSDICGFTAFAAARSVSEVTSVLNLHFSFYDTLAASLNGVEKIKTVGDAFVAFGQSNVDSTVTVLLGLGIIRSVRIANELTGSQLRVRVGACSGDFYLCVYGSHKKMTFDLFGDATVEMERLEKTADIDMLQVNERLLKLTERTFAYADRSMIGIRRGVPFETALEEAIPADEDVRSQLLRAMDTCVSRFSVPQPAGSSTDLAASQGDEVGARAAASSVGRRSAPFALIEQVIGSRNATSTMSITGSLTSLPPDSETNDTENAVVVPLAPKKKWKCSDIRCVSSVGLIYPLLLFRSCTDEGKAIATAFEKSHAANVLMMVFWTLFEFSMVICMAIMYPELFAQLDPVLMTGCAAVAVHVLSFIPLLVPMASWEGPSRLWVTAIVFVINHVFMKAMLVLMTYRYDTMLGKFLYTYAYMSAVVTVWDSLAHFYLKIASFVLDAALMTVWHALKYGDLNADKFQEQLVLLISYVFGVLTREVNVKRAYDGEVRTNLQLRDLRLEKNRNESLITSVLPKSVALRFLKSKFRNFSLDCESFVCFVGLTNFTQLFRTEAPESLVGFLSVLFTDFDDLLEVQSFVTIKKIQSNYLFISPPHKPGEGVDMLVTVLSLLQSFREAFHVRQSSYRPAQEMKFRAGLSYGTFGAGVLGCEKFLFDVFGTIVNLSARLLMIGESEDVAVSLSNITHCLSPAVSVKPFGERCLKGIGEAVGCGSLSLAPLAEPSLELDGVVGVSTK